MQLFEMSNSERKRERCRTRDGMHWSGRRSQCTITRRQIHNRMENRIQQNMALLFHCFATSQFSCIFVSFYFILNLKLLYWFCVWRTLNSIELAVRTVWTYLACTVYSVHCAKNMWKWNVFCVSLFNGIRNFRMGENGRKKKLINLFIHVGTNYCSVHSFLLRAHAAATCG